MPLESFRTRLSNSTRNLFYNSSMQKHSLSSEFGFFQSKEKAAINRSSGPHARSGPADERHCSLLQQAGKPCPVCHRHCLKCCLQVLQFSSGTGSTLSPIPLAPLFPCSKRPATNREEPFTYGLLLQKHDRLSNSVLWCITEAFSAQVFYIRGQAESITKGRPPIPLSLQADPIG